MLLAVINTLWICFISLDLVQSYNIHASIYSAFLRIRKITSILGSWTWWKDLKYTVSIIQFSSVQSLSRVWLFATPWITACQDSLSITNSQSPPKPMSVESVIPSNQLILCRPLLLLPSIFPSIRVFSSESTLHKRWPKYWSFSLNISPSNEHPELISLGWTGWISMQSKGPSTVFSNTTVQKHQFFCIQLSL